MPAQQSAARDLFYTYFSICLPMHQTGAVCAELGKKSPCNQEALKETNSSHKYKK